MLRRKVIGKGVLVLTFDDGPGNRLTPEVLKILQKHNVKGTFFLLGRNITGREEIVRQIVQQGHQICSHSYQHLNQLKVSPIRAIEDIKQGWQAIDNVLGVKNGTYPFRPPYGKLNLISLIYLWIRKVPIVYWTTDSGDTWDIEELDARRTAESIKKAGGGIILAHDFDRFSDDRDSYVLESLRMLIDTAEEMKMSFCTVSQLSGSK